MMLTKSKKIFSKSNHHVFDDFVRIDVEDIDNLSVYIYFRHGDLSMNIYQNIHSMEISHFAMNVKLNKEMCEIKNLINALGNGKIYKDSRFSDFRLPPNGQQEHNFRNHVKKNITKIHKEIVDVYKILEEY